MRQLLKWLAVHHADPDVWQATAMKNITQIPIETCSEYWNAVCITCQNRLKIQLHSSELVFFNPFRFLASCFKDARTTPPNCSSCTPFAASLRTSRCFSCWETCPSSMTCASLDTETYFKTIFAYRIRCAVQVQLLVVADCSCHWSHIRTALDVLAFRSDKLCSEGRLRRGRSSRAPRFRESLPCNFFQISFHNVGGVCLQFSSLSLTLSNTCKS